MSILELVKSYGRRLPKTAVSVVFTAMPMCIVFADGDDANHPKNWYLINNGSDTDFNASTNMEAWAEGSVDGTPGQPTASLSADAHYFVEGGWQFTTPRSPYEFPGLSLTLGSDSEDGSLCLRYDNQTFKNLILKRGSVIQYRHRSDTSSVRYYNAIFGEATVESSKANPIVIKSRQDRLWMGWCGKLIGDENACMSVGSPDFALVNLLVSITNAAAYHGEIVVTSKFANTGRRFGAGLGVGGSIPGTVRIKGGSMIKPHDPVAVAELGELHMDEGTEMRFVYDSDKMTGGQIRVKTALTLPNKVKVHALTGHGDNKWMPPISTTGEEVYSPFLVGPPGVRIKQNIFEFVPDPACEPQKVDDLRPQRVHFETKTDPETDRDTVYAVLEPIVWMKTGQEETLGHNIAVARGSALTNGTFWSDNRDPHPDAHYVVDRKGRYLLSTCESNEEFVFPGKSLLFYQGNFGVFGSKHRLKIPDLRLATLIRQGQSASVTICGGRVSLCGEEVKMQAYHNNTLTIESEIVGDANLKLVGEVNNSSHGHFALTGLNTNWFKKITVVAPENANVDDWEKDYLSIHLYDGRNLGGKLDKFDYSALDLGRLCDLYAHTNVTLDATVNRGIFISNEMGARISVDEGYTLNCHWPITLNGPLYKTQPGTLALGGGIKFYEVVDNVTNITDALPEDPSKRLLVITNGVVKALTHDCVNGLTVALAKDSDTSLALDFTEEDCDLKKYGFYNVKTDTPFEPGKPINIRLDGVDGDKLRGWKEYKQGLVTVKTSAANALGVDNLVKFKKPSASGVLVRLVRDDDPEGTTTYSAYYKFVGTQIILR